MSVNLCIKYALGHVTVEHVTWIFNELFGEELVIKVTELIKDDRYKEGKKFKMFFIECDMAKQTKGNLEKLERNITKNNMAKVTIDAHGHFWQVTFGREKADFKPTIVEEPADELRVLYGRKQASEGVFELELAPDDPIMREAMEENAARHWPLQAPR